MAEPKKTAKAAAPKATAAKKPPARATQEATKPAKAVAKPAASAAVVPEGKSDGMRLKDLLDRVAELAGVKKHAAKPVVEATLKLLGDALQAGETLILPPFGRAKVSRSRATDKGAALTVKLKRMTAGKAAEPLAADEEQG